MQLSELLGRTVHDSDGARVGTVVDVRLAWTEDRAPEVVGLVVSPHTRSSYLGYERTTTRAPLLLAALARWRHRGTFLAGWTDLARIGSEHIVLRPGYARRSALLF
ncbi:hypothetical protein V4U86_20690 [Mycobacterium sp. AMU20-3851]|uniref:PRC-barrel domain-containing protein n=1 Tax=Mycobacterium sp. AMU20-3851 TaxID=3122055 RepID=UPI0037545D14